MPTVTATATSAATKNGQSYRFRSRPVVRPAVVTKVACARLIMPPCPVTITKLMKMSANASPLAITPIQNSLARNMM
jgi:hypothetical protein